MIQSMTGFGKSQTKDENYHCNIEIRSLNNRYTEIRIFGIKDLLEIENEIIAKVKKRFHRGKFDINIKLHPANQSSGFDEKKLASHHRNLKMLSKKMGIHEPISIETVVKTLPQTSRNVPLRKIKNCLDAGIDKALTNLENSRKAEGRQLASDIQKRLRWMIKEIKGVERRTKSAKKRKFRELKNKVEGLISEENIDRSRLEMEVAMLIERSDITEELVRLSSHMELFQQVLTDKQNQKGIGRKLDFFIQEINREINTIGSKVSDVFTTNSVVQLKSELEKVREQVQNLE